MSRMRTRSEGYAASKDSQPLTYLSVVEQVTGSGITQVELGKAVGAQVRTVQTWAAGSNQPTGIRAQRLLDIQTIVSLLSDSYTDEGIKIWLHSRNRNLDMHRPIELLVEGQIDEVLEEAQWVASVEDGFVATCRFAGATGERGRDLATSRRTPLRAPRPRWRERPKSMGNT